MFFVELSANARRILRKFEAIRLPELLHGVHTDKELPALRGNQTFTIQPLVHHAADRATRRSPCWMIARAERRIFRSVSSLRIASPRPLAFA
jgi:hypothetical protein